MTAAQSSEDNDGHQFRATIGPRGNPPQGADQSGILSRFPEALAPRTSIVAVAGGSASGARASFDISAAAPEAFRGLSEGFIGFEALVAAATGSRHCPPTAAPRDRIRRQGGRPAIVVRAGRLRPGRTGILEPAEPLDLSGEDRAITPRGMTTDS
jgi:hypothetical protein